VDEKLRTRFEAKVDRSGQHYLWTGSRTTDGAGKLKVDGRTVSARRVACELERVVAGWRRDLSALRRRGATRPVCLIGQFDEFAEDGAQGCCFNLVG
jgi:hypothetical protein